MRISEHVFNNEDVVLDFHEFDHCEFNRCRLILFGCGPFTMINNQFNECSFHVDGPAKLTLRVLSQLYHGGFQAYVENLLAQLRAHPPQPPDSCG